MQQIMQIALLACALVWGGAQAAPSTGPLIDHYGPVFDVPDTAFPIDIERRQKIVFDLAKSPESGLNRSLESVARYLNMNARVGVPAANMELVVVAHGGALRNLLSETAFRKRHDSSNPNHGLVVALMDAGVTFYICGQSAGFAGISSGEFIPGVKMALSAMTVLDALQAGGYSVLP